MLVSYIIYMYMYTLHGCRCVVMVSVHIMYLCPEYCAVPYQTVIKIPKGVTLTDAAGLSQYILCLFGAYEKR